MLRGLGKKGRCWYGSLPGDVAMYRGARLNGGGILGICHDRPWPGCCVCCSLGMLLSVSMRRRLLSTKESGMSDASQGGGIRNCAPKLPAPHNGGGGLPKGRGKLGR